MGDSIQPCLDLIFHRLPYWIDYFGIPLCSIVPTFHPFEISAMSIVLPGRIPSHSLRKAVTSPQQNRGVSPSLAKFLSDNCSATFKKLSLSRPRPRHRH